MYILGKIFKGTPNSSRKKQNFNGISTGLDKQKFSA